MTVLSTQTSATRWSSATCSGPLNASRSVALFQAVAIIRSAGQAHAVPARYSHRSSRDPPPPMHCTRPHRVILHLCYQAGASPCSAPSGVAERAVSGTRCRFIGGRGHHRQRQRVSNTTPGHASLMQIWDSGTLSISHLLLRRLQMMQPTFFSVTYPCQAGWQTKSTFSGDPWRPLATPRASLGPSCGDNGSASHVAPSRPTWWCPFARKRAVLVCFGLEAHQGAGAQPADAVADPKQPTNKEFPNHFLLSRPPMMVKSHMYIIF